ncbi:MAG: glycosyltransferase [archaeon]
MTKKYSISVLVPAWNERETIGDTIREIFKSDYPLKEVIVLNDGSTDNTAEIVEKLLKIYPRLKLINKQNSGKADSLNQGIKLSKGELVAVVDADSYPEKDAFSKLVGFFDDDQVGVATPFIIPRNNKSFMERLQFVEYHVIAFTRKLLGYVEAIYVTPGPMAIYRKSALEKIGGFDVNNLTEDIEATWHLTYQGYKRRMCLLAESTTTIPNKIKAWYKQRRRWNVGGLQCIAKYKKYFFKKGMLGFFILPFFVLQLFLGLLGLGIFVYLVTTRFLTNYLFTRYSINVGIPLLTMNDFFITPSFLNYLGVILFIAGVIFTFLILSVMKSNMLRKQNIFNLLFYFLFYLSVYPFIMVVALYHFFKGKKVWR